MNFPDNSLSLARHQLIKDIRLTQTLALLDDKFLDRSTSSENVNRSKFWFKSFWQVQIQKANNPIRIYYSIYYESPNSKGIYNFKPDKDNNQSKLYIDSLTKKYMIGNWEELSGQHLKDEVTTNLNLTLEYGIQSIEFFFLKSHIKGWKNKLNILFDNFGRPYILQTKNKKKLTDFTIDTTLHPFEYLLQEPIQIKLVKEEDEVCFNLEPISGYLHIEDCIYLK